MDQQRFDENDGLGEGRDAELARFLHRSGRVSLHELQEALAAIRLSKPGGVDLPTLLVHSGLISRRELLSLDVSPRAAQECGPPGDGKAPSAPLSPEERAFEEAPTVKLPRPPSDRSA
jgi:hypothetical protein